MHIQYSQLLHLRVELDEMGKATREENPVGNHIRKKFLTVRVVWQWNRLAQEVVDSPSLEMFKQKLNRHLLEMH